MSSVNGHDSVLEAKKTDEDVDTLSVDSLNLHPPPLLNDDSMRYGLSSINNGARGPVGILQAQPQNSNT